MEEKNEFNQNWIINRIANTVFDDINLIKKKICLRIDCTIEVENMIASIPTEILKEDFEKLKNLWILHQKKYKYIHSLPYPQKEWSYKHYHEWVHEKWIEESREIYQEIIKIVIERINKEANELKTTKYHVNNVV